MVDMGKMRQGYSDGIGSTSSRFGAVQFSFLFVFVDFLLRICILWFIASSKLEYECSHEGYKYTRVVDGYLIDSLLYVPPEFVPPYWMFIFILLVMWIFWVSELTIAAYRQEYLRWHQIVLYGICAAALTNWSYGLYNLHELLRLQWYVKREQGYPTTEEICSPTNDHLSFLFYESGIEQALGVSGGLVLMSALLALALMWSINRSIR